MSNISLYKILCIGIVMLTAACASRTESMAINEHPSSSFLPHKVPPSIVALNTPSKLRSIELGRLSWPTRGPILTYFDGKDHKGIDIGGTIGESIFAAGEGRVLYADKGLRGYGNLIIIKHNDLLLTAYAHNRILLVKEGDIVGRGQKISEMGSSENGHVKLHFEVIRKSKPVNPLDYLSIQ